MPIENSLKLMKNRKNKFDKNACKDIHESNIEYLKESYDAACELAKEYNWTEIKCVKDGNIRTREDIANEIFENVKEVF